jgi:nitrate/nitrite-specific signal transduction histidine kinase
MPRFFKIKRLKIAEQILIILVFAVVIPMTISAFIINNINQQAVRAQLVNSAILIANMISESADIFVEKDLSLEVINKKIFKTLKDDERQIYIISTKNNQLILSHNFTQSAFDSTMKVLPKKLKTEEAVVFSKIKNQPLVYIKKDNPEILIIVNTTKEITKRTITKNSARIILSTIIAALMVIFIVGIYTYYLYINIRQLFKGIIAISKGSYGRRIRLLTNAFTPYEVVFLAFEFNKMSLKIKHSYQELKKANKELKKMNEFRSNMIDTVSHEFRTPLTSIQGYTSRLLRQDIQID